MYLIHDKKIVYTSMLDDFDLHFQAIIVYEKENIRKMG